MPRASPSISAETIHLLDRTDPIEKSVPRLTTPDIRFLIRRRVSIFGSTDVSLPFTSLVSVINYTWFHQFDVRAYRIYDRTSCGWNFLFFFQSVKLFEFVSNKDP